MLRSTEELHLDAEKKFSDTEKKTLAEINTKIDASLLSGYTSIRIRRGSKDMIMSEYVIEELTDKGYQIEHDVYKSSSDFDHTIDDIYTIIWSGKRYTKPGTYKKKFNLTEDMIVIFGFIVVGLYFICK